MGFRFGKSIRLGKHFRINISKSGLGVSAGVKGLRVGVGPRGARLTAGIPGTGLSYVAQSGGGGSPPANTVTSKRPKPESGPPQTTALPSPGFFAPRHEKDFVQGIEEYQAGRLEQAVQHFFAVAPADAAGGLYAAIILAGRDGREADAIRWLEGLVDADVEFPTPLMQKYGADGAIRIRVTPNVVAVAPMDNLGAALLLAELYQEQDRAREAIGLLEEVEEIANDPLLTLSLCELYADQGLWDGVVERGGGTVVEDDVTLETAILHGRALQEKSLHQSAIQVLTEAVRRKKNRSRDLLSEALYWRAVSYEAVGDTRRANKEFQKVYAQAPGLRDVAGRVAASAPDPTRGIAPPGEKSAKQFCGRCGNAISEPAKYCGQCGSAL